jgi:ubiquinone/menaquinone biosynthesis C-methylase UbiE
MAASNVSFSGSIPENYERYLGPFIFEPYAVDVVSRIHVQKVKKVLELACGTGRVTKHLVQTLPDAEIVASDFNPDMIAIAENNAKSDNIKWMTIDMQDIPFDDNHFDLVVCQFGIMFVPDKQKAFQEIHRVLKTGGVLLLNAWDALTKNPPFTIANLIVNSFFTTDPVLFYHVPFSYHDETEMKHHLAEAGFHSAVIKLVPKICVSDSAAHAVKGLLEGNPVFAFIQERNPAVLPDIRKKLEEELVLKLGDHPMRCAMQAWVIEAVK